MIGNLDNQEDSIIFNQSAIDRGIFRADSLKKFESEILKNPSTSQDDIFTKPEVTASIAFNLLLLFFTIIAVAINLLHLQ